MKQAPFLPPPPPQAQDEETRKGVRRKEFHFPGTNIFKGFRQQIAALERPPSFRDDLEPVLAVIGAFVLSAFFTLFVSLGQVGMFLPIFAGENRWIGSVFLAPPVEEIMKALSVVAVALVLPRSLPNRRYAAAIGAAAGLGYALSEDITYFGNPDAHGPSLILRLITNPIGHPVFTALCAIGVFVFMAKLRSGVKVSKAISGLPLFMLLLAVLNHASWNAWQFGVVSSLGYLGVFLSILVIVVPFLFILRDFLGGHFNFRHFLESIPEPPPLMPVNEPPPLPPPQYLSASGQVQGGKLKSYYQNRSAKQERASEAT